MKKANSKVWITVLVLIFSLIVIMLAGSAAAEGDTVATLSLDPAGPVVLSVGSNADVDIRMDNITNVYGAQVKLSFDETIIQVSGEQLTPGTCPQPDIPQLNEADNSTGVIEYAVAQKAPTEPCNGGVMATINFECVAEGESSVAFTENIISDPNGIAILHTAVGGSIKCEPAVFEITGEVALQAWTDPTGVQVSLYDSQGLVDGPMEVGSDGLFKFLANDETKTYRVVAEYDRYLPVQKTDITGINGMVVNLGPATLQAGDINGDGKINILDLTALGGNFGKENEQEWVP
jgi:hypothetical protein